LNRTKLRRDLYTLTTLRPVQIYGRVLHRVRRPRVTVGAPLAPRRPEGRWEPGARRVPSMLGPETFLFLSHTARLASHWDHTAESKLWLYNLHYFDDLNAAGAEERREWHRPLLERWARENPPPHGVGWDPYPLSLRIVNWIKWGLGGGTLEGEPLHSLATQARVLEQRMEHHLLGNHLLANAKALVFAGAFFEGEEAARWLRTGLAIMRRELKEQILPDGGHFELSPMYQGIMLEDVLDLINLSGAFPASLASQRAAWETTAASMHRWLAAMCHPDGEIGFFNDAAIEISPSPAELDAYSGRLGLRGPGRPADGITHLAESGYIRLQNEAAVCLIDAAEVGPRYLAAHAHADTLSFELSVCGKRVLVNAGTSTYQPGDQRHRERGTASHNTVLVDDHDSSEVYGTFRAARRAHPLDVRCETLSDGTLVVSGAHDGYRRLPGRVTHRREWRLGPGSLQVTDALDGRYERAVCLLHAHPAFAAATSAAGPACVELSDGERTVEIRRRTGAWSLAPGEYHPRFGETLPTATLAAAVEGAAAVFEAKWD
jgi:uncharacterized heparinase superfamily protein